MSISRGVFLFVAACSTPRRDPVPADAPVLPSPPPPATSSAPPAPIAAPVVDAAPPPAEPPKVKVVTIGMHVGGGPFDEATKEPFKRAVEPHFPEILDCWGKHIASNPKQVDVGVDLLIEASGGHPKTSNPRATGLAKSETAALLPCVIGVFESVAFPTLERGRTGVSYSLRFTPR